MRGALGEFGSYVLFIGRVFRRPSRWGIFWERTIDESWNLAIRSIWIVAIVSLFIGAVITIEMAINLKHPMMPAFVVGTASRDVILLEFSSTIIALVLAGKVGGSVASEIGTMRITEQIDALDVMGINSAAYLVLPKVVGSVVTFPLLTAMSAMIAIIGGGFFVVATGYVSAFDYIDGIRSFVTPFYVPYAMGKMAAFAFIIISIPAFYGYRVHGGSLEVGQASTRGVVSSSIGLLVVNLLFTKFFLV